MLSAGSILVKGIRKGSQAGRVVQQAAHDSVYRGNGCDQQAKSKMIVYNNPICKSPDKRWRAINSKKWRKLSKGLKGWYKSLLAKQLAGHTPLSAYFKRKGYAFTYLGGENILVPIKRFRRGAKLTASQVRSLKVGYREIRRALWNRFVYKNRRPKGLKVPATKSRVKLRPPPIRPGRGRIKMPTPLRRRLPVMKLPSGPIIVGRRRPSTPPARRSVPRPAPSPAVRPRPVAPARPRPAVNQIKLQRALIAAVRKVRRFKKYSDPRAKGVLKYSWSMLEAMKVAPHILSVFRRFGRPTTPEAAEAKLIEILRNWQISSGSVQPSRTPPRPVPVYVRPSPRPVYNQRKIQDALIKAVKKVRRFKKYSDKSAKGVLKYSWSMLKIMQVAPQILVVFRKFGLPTAPKLAEAKLKQILAKWK